ncbi:hypothetical protein ACFWPQ_38825 [Streptomyces sp. NPDC058464]|uniref:hypothetical protein n=1 Tax=Streptomyces sp. NPDC058464 TaxID=3346511 RepID=UPI00364E2071
MFQLRGSPWPRSPCRLLGDFDGFVEMPQIAGRHELEVPTGTEVAESALAIGMPGRGVDCYPRDCLYGCGDGGWIFPPQSIDEELRALRGQRVGQRGKEDRRNTVKHRSVQERAFVR